MAVYPIFPRPVEMFPTKIKRTEVVVAELSCAGTVHNTPLPSLIFCLWAELSTLGGCMNMAGKENAGELPRYIGPDAELVVEAVGLS